MARLIHILFQPHNDELEDGKVNWVPSPKRRTAPALPQLVWASGMPFREANLWAHHRASDSSVSLQTIQSNLAKLLPYANFLEKKEIDWWHFPLKRSEQCLIQYRGYLIACREGGEISPSGASHRMNAAIKFYRFLQAEGLFDSEKKLWKERRFSFSTVDAIGLQRTFDVRSTDLSIPNRKRRGITLEGGLQPLSRDALKELIPLSKKHAPRELYLMIMIGVCSGLRIGTISDLKVATLLNAAPDPASPHHMLISVGPGATPSVATKFSVTGQIALLKPVYGEIMAYAKDVRRLKRESIAAPEHKNHLFLTKYGKPYSSGGADSSSAIRTLVKQVRDAAVQIGSGELAKFRFHQTRATFATRLATQLMGQVDSRHVLALVKRALLVQSEATALHYIRYVEQTPVKSKFANDFTRDLLGMTDEVD